MNPTGLLNAPTAGASLNDLRTAFDQALSELPDWKREEAGIVLAALRNTLPPSRANQIQSRGAPYLPLGRRTTTPFRTGEQTAPSCLFYRK